MRTDFRLSRGVSFDNFAVTPYLAIKGGSVRFLFLRLIAKTTNVRLSVYILTALRRFDIAYTVHTLVGMV